MVTLYRLLRRGRGDADHQVSVARRRTTRGPSLRRAGKTDAHAEMPGRQRTLRQRDGRRRPDSRRRRRQRRRRERSKKRTAFRCKRPQTMSGSIETLQPRLQDETLSLQSLRAEMLRQLRQRRPVLAETTSASKTQRHHSRGVAKKEVDGSGAEVVEEGGG